MPAFEAASLPSKFEGLWEVSVHARILQNLIEKTIEIVNALTVHARISQTLIQKTIEIVNALTVHASICCVTAAI